MIGINWFITASHHNWIIIECFSIGMLAMAPSGTFWRVRLTADVMSRSLQRCVIHIIGFYDDNKTNTAERVICWILIKTTTAIKLLISRFGRDDWWEGRREATARNAQKFTKCEIVHDHAGGSYSFGFMMKLWWFIKPQKSTFSSGDGKENWMEVDRMTPQEEDSRSGDWWSMPMFSSNILESS